MTDQKSQPAASAAANAGKRSSAAERALAEAEERRQEQAKREDELPPELGGRKGLEPTRYGDWEKGGIASDF